MSRFTRKERGMGLMWRASERAREGESAERGRERERKRASEKRKIDHGREATTFPIVMAKLPVVTRTPCPHIAIRGDQRRVPLTASDMLRARESQALVQLLLPERPRPPDSARVPAGNCAVTWHNFCQLPVLCFACGLVCSGLHRVYPTMHTLTGLRVCGWPPRRRTSPPGLRDRDQTRRLADLATRPFLAGRATNLAPASATETRRVQQAPARAPAAAYQAWTPSFASHTRVPQNTSLSPACTQRFLCK